VPREFNLGRQERALRTFKVGDVILDKYEIVRRLGKGGMGLVVAARHRELHDEVA